MGSHEQQNLQQILALPIAADWAKPFRQRVAAQCYWRSIQLEAVLATIEAVTRKLRTRGWKRRRTSTRKRDGHADSRYYRKGDYEIRISSHLHPRDSYSRPQYIVTLQTLYDYNVLGLVLMIERDLEKHLKQQRKVALSPIMES